MKREEKKQKKVITTTRQEESSKMRLIYEVVWHICESCCVFRNSYGIDLLHYNYVIVIHLLLSNKRSLDSSSIIWTRLYRRKPQSNQLHLHRLHSVGHTFVAAYHPHQVLNIHSNDDPYLGQDNIQLHHRIADYTW